RGFEPPCGETERVLAEIWSDLLGVERVSRNDDFFELGGHSLLAVQMIHRFQAASGFAMTLEHVFDTRSLAELAELAIDNQLREFDEDMLPQLVSELGDVF
ncbi:phosphopantetheine-binding protein, partial [Methylosinus sp. Sm6]|uniref:phosphopantetheine-binding protein n=1 Tax=Methylosinus sp. Sm6 TaxID=2866948 RepID=UPI001C99F4D5